MRNTFNSTTNVTIPTYFQFSVFEQASVLLASVTSTFMNNSQDILWLVYVLYNLKWLCEEERRVKVSVVSNTVSNDNVKTKFHMERVGGSDESNNNFNLDFFFFIGLSATVTVTYTSH